VPVANAGAQEDAAARLARWRVPLGFVTAAAAFVLARPTWASWSAGFAVACVGGAMRVWAAGHIEKSREVTTTGPYRWMRHPLYVGSAVLALGVVIASRSVTLAALTALYLAATFWAAIRTEEAFLKRTFGSAYDAYTQSDEARSHEVRPARRFSIERAWRNREYRALVGLLVGFLLLAMRVRLPL
jgi:protein-S-isoprenylcysteine O-methyltransferase Ste14